MTKAIVFRAEASNQLGLGHMFRCLNFVRSLPFEVNPIFVMRGCSEQEQVTQVLKNNHWDIYFLPHEIDYKTDAATVLKIADKNHANLVVTDLCHRYSIEDPGRMIFYHQCLKQMGSPFVLSIEDCRMSGFASDAAVVWNSNEELDLGCIALEGCKVLVGTKYLICDPKFSLIDSNKRQIRKKADRVLVCIGGSDPKGITLNILKAISKRIDLHIKVRVVLGDGVLPNIQKEIDLICRSQKKNISIVKQADSMAVLLSWADIAVVGEGLLKYESAILGTPSLMVPQYDLDSRPIVEFIRTGCSRRMGKRSDIGSAISYLLTNFEIRKKMSLNGISHFDGRGMERIYSSVLKNLFEKK